MSESRVAPVDDERFQRLLRDFGSAIERLASVYEAEPNEREDLVQEIVFALWRALPSFRGECSEKTFVYRIAQNRGLTHRWRQRACNARTVDVSEMEDALPDPSSQVDMPAALRRIGREELLSAVQQLPGLHRDVIVLSLEGLLNGEIAEVLGLSANNVAVRLTRARAALRRILTRENEP